MGSFIEINDTLQLTSEQGFPSELTLKKHLKKAFTVEDLKDRVFEFRNKPDLRIYHLKPTRVFLVHNIDGKWLYWGHAMILEETLHAETKTTSGKFIITKIYEPSYQREFSLREASSNKQFLFS